MRKSKITALILLAALLLSFSTGYVTFAAYSDNVLFEYDFEDYTGGKPSKGTSDDDVYLSGTGGFALLKKGEATDGNVYMYSDSKTSNKGRAVLYFDESLNTGKLNVSFDIGRGTLDGGFNGTTTDYMQVRDKISGSGMTYFYYASASEGVMYASNGSSKDEGTTLSFDKNEIYRVDLLFDFTNAKQTTYVDGKIFKQIDYDKALTVLDIFITWSVGYFDNLKVAKVTDNSFEGTATPSEGYVDVSFSETPAADAITSGAQIVNTVTGEVIPVTDISKTGHQSYRLSHGGSIMPGAEYIIENPEPIKNFCGNEYSGELSFTKETAEKAIKRIKLIDYLGNESCPKADIAPQTKEIEIIYSGLDASDAPGSTVSLSLGTEELAYSSVYDSIKQTLKITLDEYLMGSSTYSLSVNDSILGTVYSDIGFGTSEGSFDVSKFGFFKNGQEVDFDALSDGDTVNLVIEVIKTLPAKKDMVLSYSAWENGYLKGFDFLDVSLSASETYKSASIENIVINKNQTLNIDSIKGFLWTALGSNNPLVTEVILD